MLKRRGKFSGAGLHEAPKGRGVVNFKARPTGAEQGWRAKGGGLGSIIGNRGGSLTDCVCG